MERMEIQHERCSVRSFSNVSVSACMQFHSVTRDHPCTLPAQAEFINQGHTQWGITSHKIKCAESSREARLERAKR